MTRDEAWHFAEEWAAAWNAHDLERILSHYDDAVELTSPVAARLLARGDGQVRGKDELRDYFRRGLEAFPQLRFELVDVLWGLSSMVVYYVNQRGTKSGEYMEFASPAKVGRVVAHYNAE